MKVLISAALILPLILISCVRIPDNPNPGQVIIEDSLPENYKVCVIGDSGKDNEGQRIVADTLMEEGCNQVRHTGDIIYGKGIENADDPEFFKRFHDYYSPLYENGIPFYVSQGNHDYKKKPEAWLEVAKRHEGIKFPSMYFMDIFGDICFLTIDTNSFPFAQLKWLRKIKKEYRKTCKMTLAFGHHPRYSSGKHGNASVLIRTFLNKMVVGKLDAYFAGHDHNQEDAGVSEGTHFFVSGGAAEYRYIKYKPRNWAQAKLGYQIFTVHHDDTGHPYIKFTFYSIDEETKEKKIEHTGEVTGVGFR